jgi:glutathione S-transferase
MATMQLHGTPLSHFTRKIRILLAELGVPHDFVRARSVMASTAEDYASHPLLRVPTLVHGDVTIIESDHIARYVVERFDASDRFRVNSTRPDDANRLAVVNGVMANEVVLILAKRGGLDDLASVAYFRKLAGAMDSGLAWLEERVVPGAELDYPMIALVSLWQHLVHYRLELIAPLERYPRIAASVEEHAARPSVLATTPEQSLADAKAAGWSPA